jgi:Arc/MetJ-type ribon-helix-helix transcriptional regulator
VAWDTLFHSQEEVGRTALRALLDTMTLREGEETLILMDSAGLLLETRAKDYSLKI